ncbi:uncharacterized protein LOC126834578 [Adelges cooleyi]|uniref:uncharacterized protein LOC126834578 n=1 Tax=Adelges cooleyi TaxID=133065 RepID=UPI00217F9898|nr:uncharacterized protein LOC126834578 [Adelges cooleyi]
MLKTGVFVMVMAVTGQVIYGNETVAKAQSDAAATASNGDGAPTVSTGTTTSTSSNSDGSLSDNVETESVVQSDPLPYEASVLPYGNYCPTDHSSNVASYQQPSIQETSLTQQPVPNEQYYQPSYSQVQSVPQIQPNPISFPQQYTSEPYAYYQGYPPSFAANAYQRGFISKPCDLRNEFC